MTNNDSTPGTPDEQPTTPIAPAPDAAPTPTATAPVKRRGRTALIAGGAVLGAAVLIGGGIAIGAALSDDDDDSRDFAFVAGRGDDRANELAEGNSDQTGRPGASNAPTANGGAAAGAASADDLIAVATAATGVFDGGVVSIDANRDGSWDVEVRAADGSEAEVRVEVDGTATVRETDGPDDDDRGPQYVLDAASLSSIVSAALAEVDGRIVDVDADDDGRSPYDITILTADNRTVDIDLDASGSVVGTDIDD